MRAGRPLLLLTILALGAGCLSAPAADEAAPAEHTRKDAEPTEAKPTNATAPPTQPAPSAPVAPEPTPAAAEETPADETMRVSWSPETPAAGDVLRVAVAAPHRWPEPHCSLTQLARDGVSGGEGASFPATETEDGYVCERAVLEGMGAVVVSVTRPDGERLRVSGPHVVEVAEAEGDPLLPPRERFVRFDLAADDAGVPIFSVEVPPTMADVAAPAVGPLPGSHSTRAGVTVEAVTRDHGIHIGRHAEPEWTSPFEWRALADVRAWVVEVEKEDAHRDYDEDGFVLLGVGYAWSPRGFATSDGVVMGFGSCADGSCFVVDG